MNIICPFQLASIIWYGYMDRYLDLIETVIFIMKKKYNQVSFLHVYHHIFVIVTGWVTVKYTAGGMAILPLNINCFVHCIMYTYYLLSSFPNLQFLTAFIKPYITVVQMASNFFFYYKMLDYSLLINLKFSTGTARYHHCILFSIGLSILQLSSGLRDHICF